MSNERVIEEHGNLNRKKVISLASYSMRGRNYRVFELGEYYFKPKEQEWKKRKSVSLNTGNYRVMKEAIDRDHELIMDWLGVDYVAEDVVRYTEIQELSKLDAEYVVGEHIIKLHNDLRDPQFFRTEHKGGEDEISMNLAHPFTRAFVEADDAAQVMLLNVIQSYSHTKSRLMGEMYYDPKMLFNHLETDWSRYLKDKMENGG